MENAGISAIVMRPPVKIPEKGCVFCVKLSEKRLRDALYALNNAGMSHGKIYILYADGTGVEVKA
jgi:hypothetical protein